MNVRLVDVDGHNFPNLALMKISAYHKQRGDNVDWAVGTEPCDIVYMSKVFTFTPDDDTIYQADEIVKGGTGYGLDNKLPNEIENMCPDYTIYPQFPEAYGFLTRGCPRNCPFCIVTQKEGKESKQVADLSDFCGKQKTIELLDPNLLACKDREKLLQQLIDSGAWIDFTQGLDIRLTDKYIAGMLKKIKTKSLHFAWDNADIDLSGQFEMVKRITGLDCRKLAAYVLTNFNTTHEQDLYRIYKLREIGIDPYVMIYEKKNAPRRTRLLQRWVNNKTIWRKCDRFENYDPRMG